MLRRRDGLADAQRQFERGRVADVLVLLSKERMRALEADDSPRLAELDAAVTEMFEHPAGRGSGWLSRKRAQVAGLPIWSVFDRSSPELGVLAVVSLVALLAGTGYAVSLLLRPGGSASVAGATSAAVGARRERVPVSGSGRAQAVIRPARVARHAHGPGWVTHTDRSATPAGPLRLVAHPVGRARPVGVSKPVTPHGHTRTRRHAPAPPPVTHVQTQTPVPVLQSVSTTSPPTATTTASARTTASPTTTTAPQATTGTGTSPPVPPTVVAPTPPTPPAVAQPTPPTPPAVAAPTPPAPPTVVMPTAP